MALDQRDTNEKENRLPGSLEEAGLPRDVYSLLAQANLLRMRGCWEQAVQSCMAALRLSPESPSAQSLLGDIYENQGRRDDAIQWYRMALDVNPDSPADRMKLDRLLRLQEDGTPRSLAAARLPFIPALPGQRAIGPETGSRRPPRLNAETTLRYAALAAAILVLLTVLFASLSVHRHATLAALGLTTDQEVKTPTVVVPETTGSTPTAAPTASLHDATEQALLDALNASHDLNAQGITVYDVTADPRAATVALTFGIPPGADGFPNRETVLRSALRTIQAATLAPVAQSATIFTARCVVKSPGATSPNSAALIFVGDLPRSALPATAPADTGLNAAQMQGLFGNSWWSPQITG